MKTIKNILKSLNILYAEDNKEIRESVENTLKMIFANVYSAVDGVEALKIYEENPINIILLDYVMPSIDGYEVAKEIRKHDKKIPIIILSGHTNKEKLMNGIEVGLVKYIEKPLKYSELLETLQKVVIILEENNLLKIKLDEDTQYDYISKIIIQGENKINLTRQDIDLLELLLKNKSKLVTKNQIIEFVFKNQTIEDNTLRNVIYRLRKKINLNIIITVKDLGYMIQ